MQQQVRIITTKKGYEEIMSFLRSHNNKKLTKNIVNDTTCKYINDIYFFKWDNPKYFRLLKNLLTVIINKNITQRICIIDRNYIKLYDNTLLEDEYKDIPMPSMTCEFNDKETIRLLKQIDNGGNENGV